MSKRKRLLIALLFGSVLSVTAQNGRVPALASDLIGKQRDEYTRLNSQIYSYNAPESQRIHLSEPDQVAEVVSKLQAVVRTAVNAVLDSPNPATAAITNAIQGIQGEDLALGPRGEDLGFSPNPGETNTPFAEFSDLKGGRVLLVAYTILRGGAGIPDSLPVLDFYGQTGGKWELKATAPPDLTSSTLFIRKMDAGLAGEVWYLVWGNRLGDTGTRLKICLYGFDGTTVRTVWKRDELTRGRMEKVTSRSISFSYEKVYRSDERASETLYITPNGLE